MGNERWPELPYDQWVDVKKTLHRWLQIIGKVQLSKSPWINHSWQTALTVTSRGISTSLLHDTERSFSAEFDFVDHLLAIRCSDGGERVLYLTSESVASFYERVFSAFDRLGLHVRIYGRPNELPDDTPFSIDEGHHAYDPDFANRFWRVLLQSERLMTIFRSRFVGKASPVRFFWGSFDMAATRFSGRPAPEHPGGFPHLPDLVAKEGASHEESACGFWPGNELVPFPAFYSYAYPNPKEFESAKVKPAEAYFHPQLKEFLLPYDAVRTSSSPDKMVLDFFQSTYEAAADLAAWDRASLEESPYLKLLQSRTPFFKVA